MNKKLILSLVFAAMFSSQVKAENETALVESIMKLRADVESLYTEIQDKKDAHKAQMKSFAMQQADLDAQINRQNTAFKQLQLNVENKKKEILKASEKNQDIKPVLLAAIDVISKEIKTGLPFKVKEREKDIDALRSRLETGEITPERALSQAWAAFEDSFRMTRENGIFRQEFVIDGDTVLGDVAKIGSVMLFFNAPDDRLGYVRRVGNGYEYHACSNEQEKKQVSALFEAFRKQIRSGYFTIPNALVLRGGSE